MKRYPLALVLMSAFVLFVACGGDAPTDVPPTTSVPTTAAPTLESGRATSTPAAQASGICGPGSVPEYIKTVVLAMDAQGDNYTPVDITEEFEPRQETIHAVVTLKNAPKDLALGAQWYVIQATGIKPNSKLDDTQLTISESGDRNVDFKISTPENTWPSGTYCVEIYADGNLALSKTFTVVENSTPSNATSSVLRQVVLAKESDPGTFAPVNPTSTFASNSPFIHAALEIFEAPANTRFRARWYPPGQDPLDFDLTSDGTRWLDFRLTPAPDGFPTGEYQVEIFVNDQLAETKTFVVE